ncbi:MAG: thioredoxin domain-containing protein [Candidatus Gastranaerophilales bacterium]|nr:thioredoxin domain-containing protein [Candidatus Gastranaerophilales bacterium]
MKKKFFIGLFIAAAIGLFVFAAIVLKPDDKKPVQQNLNAPIEIPDTGIITIQEAESTDKPIVAMFYVDWCTYCRRFMPVFGEFAKSYKDKYTFAVVNCDYLENEKIIKDFHIMGYPSLFVIDNQLEHSFGLNPAGLMDKAVMKKELNDYLKLRDKFFVNSLQNS